MLLASPHKHRRMLMDPSSGLFVTHTFADGATGTTSVVIPGIKNTQPATFSVNLKLSSLTPNGTVFEFGGANGVGLWFDNSASKCQIGFCAGAGTAGDGLGLTKAISVVSDQMLRIVCSAIPGDGSIALWVNGRKQLYGRATNLAFPGGLGGGTPFKVNGISGAAPTWIPVGAQVALSGVSLVSPVKMYANQRPRQHYTGEIVTRLKREVTLGFDVILS